jgi:hypothetical protein
LKPPPVREAQKPIAIGVAAIIDKTIINNPPVASLDLLSMDILLFALIVNLLRVRNFNFNDQGA